MSKQSINTLKNWFKTGLKPTQAQFWAWMDSFWHKDESIPSANIGGLQELLDTKMDKKAVVSSDQVGVYDPVKNYVYDALVAEYVSFANPDSENEQFKTEKFYRLKEDAPAGENPETHPAHWAYQGTTIGEITIDDVVGLREELDDIRANGGSNVNIEVDAEPTEGSDNLLSSGTLHTELGKKADKVTEATSGNLPELDENGNLKDSNIVAASVLQTGNVDLSDIAVGEKKIVTVEKLADGSAVVGEAISQLDKLGAPGLTTLLAETNALWDGDEITITGNNLTGALGENSQEYRIGSDFFLCVSHDNGTTTSNGSATWVRNRGQDSLTPGVSHDDNIITELETESGWSSADFKQITSKSKKGTWYRAVTGGYHYLCIDKNNGWSRVGIPATIELEISTISHPTLTANLTAHDFATNGMYDDSSDATNETSEQGQEYWDTANNFWYKRNKDGYWAKMN